MGKRRERESWENEMWELSLIHTLEIDGAEIEEEGPKEEETPTKVETENERENGSECHQYDQYRYR